MLASYLVCTLGYSYDVKMPRRWPNVWMFRSCQPRLCPRYMLRNMSNAEKKSFGHVANRNASKKSGAVHQNPY